MINVIERLIVVRLNLDLLEQYPLKIILNENKIPNIDLNIII